MVPAPIPGHPFLQRAWQSRVRVRRANGLYSNPFFQRLGRTQRVDVVWELAIALDEYLDCGWTENTERTQEPGICLTVGSRDSYSQQKEGMDQTKMPCTITNHELARGGVSQPLSFSP